MTSFEDHSVKTDEGLGRRFVRALHENGDSKSEVLRDAIVRYVEQTEGDTVESLNRRIDELREEREQFEEQRQEAERKASEIDERIDDLEARVDDLHSDGDHDELFDEVRDLYESGADLRVINDKTGKLDKLRKLASHDSVDDVIDAVASEASGGSDE